MQAIIFTDEVLKKQYKQNSQIFVNTFDLISKSDLFVIFLVKNVYSFCQKIRSLGINIKDLKNFLIISWSPNIKNKNFSAEDVVNAFNMIKCQKHEVVLISDDQSDFLAVKEAGINFILINDYSAHQKAYPVKKFFQIIKYLDLV